MKDIRERVEALGLRTVYRATASGVSDLLDPASALLPNGEFPIKRPAINELYEYSSTLPTGTTEGKVWKRWTPTGWWLCRYGTPYPEGHKYHGQIPIESWPMRVEGTQARWPREVRIPPPTMRGLV